MTHDELQSILAEHGKWVVNESNGKRANLYGADLYGANLYGANLSGTCLDPDTVPNAD